MATTKRSATTFLLDDVIAVQRHFIQNFGLTLYPGAQYIQMVLGHGASVADCIRVFSEYLGYFGNDGYAQAVYDHDRGMEPAVAWVFGRQAERPNLSTQENVTYSEQEITARALKGITWAGNKTTEDDDVLIARDIFWSTKASRDPAYASLDKKFVWVCCMTGIIPTSSPFGAPTLPFLVSDLAGRDFVGCMAALMGRPA